MTNEEVKAAFLSGQPVESGGIIYDHISAIIYRKGKEGVYMQAELYDKCGHSVSSAEPRRINIIKD